MRTTGKGADITFSVQGAHFHAHKAILAARSPVFEAALYGGMAESTTELISVKDMNFCVFSALMDYIYTDSLPRDMDYGQGDEECVTQMFRGLLLAADRYCEGRLKLLCEHELCKALDIENMIEMPQFANDRNCSIL
ncbi:hypothetical protein PR202_ga27671 [Eleusine coracana subsp. coracana]|uniref:BTB domain-containing protein n=1 Tax=Eleusine coracana subsp. coracana TaxID=191504 RepID=A0AAV5DGU4_ELECO|nr:hypothetical protein PR202_ga27671 [Eleusine coracana subsp. coracana]